MKRYLLPLLLTVALLQACSSGKTAYRRGDYADAVQKASRRLNQKPGLSRRGYELATEVIQRAFAEGYQAHQSAIQKLTAQSAAPFRWETVFDKYNTLQTMTADARKAAPAATWLATYPADYGRQLAETRQLAADERYALANDAFAHYQTNRTAARDAYEQYQKALSWVPNYRDAAQRSLEALPYALLRVAVEPPKLTPQLDPSETAELGNVLFSNLQGSNKPSTYAHLFNPNQVETGIDGRLRLYDGFPIDEVVQLAVSRYIPYYEQTTSTTQEVESDKLYKVGTKRINDSTVVDVLAKVKGKLTRYTYSIDANMAVDIRSVDLQTGQLVWTDTDQTSANWAVQWETFKGDDRALNGRTLLTATGTPPSRRDLLNSLTSDMGRAVLGTLHQRYKKR